MKSLDIKLNPTKIYSHLVSNFIPEESTCLLHGDPSTNKDLLILDLAISVTSGREFIGRSVKPGKVLYCYSDGGNDFEKMLQGYVEEKNIQKNEYENLYISNKKINFSKEDELNKYIDSILNSIGSIDLVIIDSFAYHYGGFYDSNNYEAIEALNLLKSGFRKLNNDIVIMLVRDTYNTRAQGSFEDNFDIVLESSINNIHTINIEHKKSKFYETIEDFKFSCKRHVLKNMITNHNKKESTYVIKYV